MVDYGQSLILADEELMEGEIGWEGCRRNRHKATVL